MPLSTPPPPQPPKIQKEYVLPGDVFQREDVFSENMLLDLLALQKDVLWQKNE